MALIIVLVFFGVFSVVGMVLYYTGKEASDQAQQVHATLDSALATDRAEDYGPVVDLRKSETFSSIPWLNQKLLKFELAPRLQSLLYQADLKWSASSLMAGSGFCLFLTFYLIYWRLGNLCVALLAGLALGAAPFGWVFFKRQKRLDKFQEQLPEALDLIVSAVRAGHSLVSSLGTVSRECPDPIGCEFRSCFEEQNFGLELKTAMDNMINRVPLQDLRIVVTAIMIQKESGGNLAEVLDKTSYVIRERFRLKRQVGVHTAQGRMTGWVLTLLPVALGVGMYFVNPKLMSILWTTPTGIKLLYISSGMLVVGGLIIRQIVNMDV
jgi:tight adherence protein B